LLTPTFEPVAAAAYRQPGGPWSGPSLDERLTAVAPAAVEDAVARVAGGLRASGVCAGDAVAWQSPNRDEVALLYRACWRLGAIAAPVHHQAGATETGRMLATLAPRVVVDLDALPTGTPVTEPWSAPEQLAAVLWTSGSSGNPKGVLHSQATLAYKATGQARTHGLRPDDCVLMPAPCAHISGLLNGITLAGVVPFRSVFMARWEPEPALDLIESEHVTYMVGPPTFFVGLMEARGFSTERVASLRLISSGGAGVSAAFVEVATTRLCARVKRTYGSTEAPSIVTDGEPIGAVELRVDAGGELQVRGPEVCLGYVDAEQTAAAFTVDGWYRTGDLASLDPVEILGRRDDVINRGGEKVSAAEVEAALEAHPAIRHAVVLPYPDRTMGERIAAVVVADGAFDVEAARAWFAERGVARYKTPEHVVVVDALPMLETGKPDRAELRRTVVPG
jgi:acyl-CoA synthetase (AMP-forming)/AMP-acid ligase II